MPEYAILSHTWGEDKDEVTFDDITKGTGTTKIGYRKLQFCAEQAALHKLYYFWIDTCCINKDSSTELQEAIISMFKCRASRWFKREWTLQELIAPKCVEFYSADGKWLGSKSSRAQEIAKITRIPTEALQLQERTLSQFSIDERMRWVQGRETKRGEDMAYSIMGIFDIEMTLLYGEGKEKAVDRLRRKIRRLQGNGRGHRLEEIVLKRNHFKFVLQIGTMLQEAGNQFSLVMGDSSKEGPPDLIAVSETGTRDENIEVNVVHGAGNCQIFLLRIATTDFTPLLSWTKQLDFTLTDWNGDDTLDLVVIKKSHTTTNSTEVYILSGASNFQHILLQTGKKLEQTDNTWTFGMGKWATGEQSDLFAINKESNPPEVYVLRGNDNFQSIILHAEINLDTANADFDFLVTD
ncbi:HET domain containing protein [Pyrenophora tritici-repentis]|uniref:HET domain containing protein n=1 Tax=Pyrenophora tritici-repentis TaxID=45151 RepID=A0A317A9S8_9PLEO|nr:HET domain containing protein [Pyrenophora tritici-repentis]KAG9384151.1 HET domain containing protein [Pyrenophora tritici-repentis]KAI0591384.1 HET domain-containing protein [Pyrenophora tritici-repentis]KAI0614515.1 HET domain-containing protein [Pyrenophora tritici-repentis]KAI0623102.1 HET domain-containing protein [Pyrenophora tritici-repentis]